MTDEMTLAHTGREELSVPENGPNAEGVTLSRDIDGPNGKLLYP